MHRRAPSPRPDSVVLRLVIGIGLLATAGPAAAPAAPTASTASAAPAAPAAPRDRATHDQAAQSQAAPERQGVEERHLRHLEWRNIGPALTGGRIVDFAVVPGNSSVVYVGTAGGGVWKSVDGGITWVPVFDDHGSAAIGGLAVAPSNPSVVWVATGEPNGRNLVSTSWGDGVYRSEDGGKTWEHVGLAECQQTGRVRVHPDDPDSAWVSCLGSLWDIPEENATRGLYRTTDGGESWEKVLSAGERGGIVDLDLDPRDPARLYAASWERERVDWSWISRGPESGVFRSEDGGETWERLANGLPSGEAGRYGVSVCKSRPGRVYVVGVSDEGGVYRSDDRGGSFELVNPDVRSSQYYGQVRCDPNDPDRVYVLSTRMYVSDDGGETFSTDLVGREVHVDHHALWIDPTDSRHLILGNDGGVYISRDRGESWRFVSNLPITQFYEVGVDEQEPFYHVYGGTQDNNSWGGPSSTRNESGIVNTDWYLTTGGDGFYTRIEPGDPTIVYTESQHGGLVRFDTETGERKRIKPEDPPEGDPWRWNWSAPVAISHHDPATVYFGAQVVFRSRNRGDTWEVISPDLTRGLTYGNLMNDFGTLRIIEESPHDPDVLAVGTDDGLVQITTDGGESWRQVEAMPGVPEMALIRRIVISAHDPQTLYVAASSSEYNDFTPYLVRSTDLGRSWTDLADDLPPEEPLRALAEHPRDPELLFVGTERGVHVTFDGGESWLPLDNNLPTVAIHDMEIQTRDNDLVIGTHGRSIWILDHLASLEGLGPEALAADATLFPVRPALQMHRFDRGFDNQGHAFFRAPNRPEEAILDFHVSPAAVGTGDDPGESGDDAGGEGDSGGSDAASQEESDEESADAEPPEVRLEILDSSGSVVRRLDVPQGGEAAGTHRMVWDLRHDPLYLGPEGQGDVRGPWVLPGTYTARLTVGGATSEQPVTVGADPLSELAGEERRIWHDTLMATGRILAAARAARETTSALREAADSARRAVETATTAPDDLEEEIEALETDLERVGEAVVDVSGDLGRAYSGMQGSVTLPTDDQVATVERARQRLGELVEEINAAYAERFPALSSRMDLLGLPWSLRRAVRVPDTPLPELPGRDQGTSP